MENLKLIRSSFRLKDSDLYYVINSQYEIFAEVYTYKFTDRIKTVRMISKQIRYMEIEKIVREANLEDLK